MTSRVQIYLKPKVRKAGHQIAQNFLVFPLWVQAAVWLQQFRAVYSHDILFCKTENVKLLKINLRHYFHINAKTWYLKDTGKSSAPNSSCELEMLIWRVHQTAFPLTTLINSWVMVLITRAPKHRKWQNIYVDQNISDYFFSLECLQCKQDFL